MRVSHVCRCPRALGKALGIELGLAVGVVVVGTPVETELGLTLLGLVVGDVGTSEFDPLRMCLYRSDAFNTP